MKSGYYKHSNGFIYRIKCVKKTWVLHRYEPQTGDWVSLHLLMANENCWIKKYLHKLNKKEVFLELL